VGGECHEVGPSLALVVALFLRVQVVHIEHDQTAVQVDHDQTVNELFSEDSQTPEISQSQ